MTACAQSLHDRSVFLPVARAEENAGEVEIRDALASKALYLADIGDASAAEPALELARSKTAGASQKLDLTFASLR